MLEAKLDVKNLISEPIIYSTSWTFDNSKDYVYVTKNKIYCCVYKLTTKKWGYGTFLIDAFFRLHLHYDDHEALRYAHPGIDSCVEVSLNGKESVCFKFPATDEGAQLAEKLYLVLLKVIG